MTDYRIIRSDRRTLALEIKRNGEIVVRSPMHTTVTAIAEFVSSHKDWLEKNLKKVQERKNPWDGLSSEDIARLKAKAREILPQKVEHFSRLTGLKCTGVKITGAKTRFGSCNGNNSICFSYYLMCYPEQAIDYVVLHELAHTKFHDHSWRFWMLVEYYMPDYKERRNLLKG